MGEPAIECTDVTFTYPGTSAPALEGVSLRVEPGERLGLLGPNGGGKSTLLRLILGLAEPQRGTIRVFGRSPDRARRDGLIGYVPQRSEAELAFPISGRQSVRLGAAWRTPGWRALPASLRREADRLIDLVGASEYADRPIGELSGGQRQRLLIARALATGIGSHAGGAGDGWGGGGGGGRILALDEPTVGIDLEGQQRFGELLRTVHEQLGLTILVVSHDLRVIIAGSDRVACLRRRLHTHTSPGGLTPEVLGELFSHDVEPMLGDIHVHAHHAAECPIDGHDGAHDHGHAHDHPGSGS